MPREYEQSPVTDILEFLRVEIESGMETDILQKQWRNRAEKAEALLVALQQDVDALGKSKKRLEQECDRYFKLMVDKNRIQEKQAEEIESLKKKLAAKKRTKK